jgi:hypothetical protein
MNKRAIELYTQALDFAYNKIGKEHAGKGFFEAAVAGTFVELIVQECLQQVNESIPETDCSSSGAYRTARIAALSRIKEHFGVEL